MKENSDRKKLLMIPIIIVIGIIPFIVRVSIHTNEELAVYDWLSESCYRYADVFLSWKAYLVQAVMMVMAGVLLYLSVVKKEKPILNRSMILLLIYLFCVILSPFISGNVSLAYRGSFERFEPVGVIAGYLMIFYYTYRCVRDVNDLRTLVKGSVIFIGLMLVLGILQSLGEDPFNLTFIKKLITPVSMHSGLDSLMLNREKGIAYLTLYNEDYQGMYFSLLIPVFLSMVFAAGTKAGKLAAAAYTLISLYVLYHGRSLGGWFALVFAGIIAVLMLSARSRKLRIVLPVLTGIVIAMVALMLSCIPVLRDRVSTALGMSPGRVHKITGLETGDTEAVFYYFDGNELHCSFDIDYFGLTDIRFTDKDGKELIYYVKDGVCELEERFEYADAKVYPRRAGDVMVAVFAIDDHEWPLVHMEDGSYCYLNSDMKPVKVVRIKNAGIFNDSLLSGRGGIWNKTIPLLKNHLFLGSGANTFITEYPQDDHVTLNYLYGRGYSEYNVKAHSLYLNNMLENGVLGTLCLIAFFILYAVNGIRKFCSGTDGTAAGPYLYCMQLGLFLGCIAYMVAGLINDSNVCTSPVFWAFLGASVGLDQGAGNY